MKKYFTVKTLISTLFTEELFSAGVHNVVNTTAFQESKIEMLLAIERLKKGEIANSILEAKVKKLVGFQYEVEHPKGFIMNFCLNTKKTVSNEIYGEVLKTIKDDFIIKKTEIMMNCLTNSHEIVGAPSSTEILDLALSLSF